MSRTRKPPRKPSAKAHDSGRDRRAEINASYHRRKMAERLAGMLERIVRQGNGDAAAQLAGLLVESGLSRRLVWIDKKTQGDMKKVDKTGGFHNTLIQKSNSKVSKQVDKTDKKGA